MLPHWWVDIFYYMFYFITIHLRTDSAMNFLIFSGFVILSVRGFWGHILFCTLLKKKLVVLESFTKRSWTLRVRQKTPIRNNKKPPILNFTKLISELRLLSSRHCRRQNDKLWKSRNLQFCHWNNTICHRGIATGFMTLKMSLLLLQECFGLTGDNQQSSPKCMRVQ